MLQDQHVHIRRGPHHQLPHRHGHATTRPVGRARGADGGTGVCARGAPRARHTTARTTRATSSSAARRTAAGCCTRARRAGHGALHRVLQKEQEVSSLITDHSFHAHWCRFRMSLVSV